MGSTVSKANVLLALQSVQQMYFRMDNLATVIWAGQSIHQLSYGLGSQYSICDVGCTFSTATLMWSGHSEQNLCLGWTMSTTVTWAGHSVPQLCCGPNGQYSKSYVNSIASTATVLWPGQSVQQLLFCQDSQYSNCVVECTISTANLMWAGHSVQQLCCGLFCQDSNHYVGWTV